MLDPIPYPQALHDLIYPYAQSLHLTTLPLHTHEVLLSFLFYSVLEKVISPFLSRHFIPQHYARFPPRTRINWDIHVTSFVQSILICGLTIYVLTCDRERTGDSWPDRLYGYSGGAGLVQGLAAGYFMWDLTVCVMHYRILGPLDLMHAVIAGGVSILGFRPFALYYGMSYLLFELSTPFVNIHWACDKVDMTGSSLQWYNGVVLIVTFFSCRLVWGTYITFNFFCDVWAAVWADRERQAVFAEEMIKPGGLVTMDNNLPIWMAALFCVMNLALAGLNFFWFSKMIEAVRKRFRPAEGGKQENGAAPKPALNKEKVR